MPALDYERAAAVYDDYCVYSGDVEYLVATARGTAGPVLELMAGTGRVTLPLAAAGARVVAVDASPAMLARLAAKVRAAALAASPLGADVRALPVTERFRLALLPFQGFTELLAEGDQRRMLAAVHAALLPGGRFLCTSHNPVVRSRTLDGVWRSLGEFPASGGGSVRVSLCGGVEDGGRVARGLQRIEMWDATGAPAGEVLLDLAFGLAPAARLLALARSAGFACVRLHGDYAGAPFDEATSPVIVALLEKRT